MVDPIDDRIQALEELPSLLSESARAVIDGFFANDGISCQPRFAVGISPSIMEVDTCIAEDFICVVINDADDDADWGFGGVVASVMSVRKAQVGR